MAGVLALPVVVPAILLVLLLFAAAYWHPQPTGPREVAEPEPEPPDEPLLVADGPAEEPIQDSRAVVPTDLVLVWRHGLRETEFVVAVDTVSCDHLAFEGYASRAGETARERRLFHTMDLPHECLVAARTPAGQPITDMRDWLAALPLRG